MKAVQNGRVVFVLMCSYKIPEPAHPFFQRPMPAGVIAPEQSMLQETQYENMLKYPHLTDRQRETLTIYLEVRADAVCSIAEPHIQDRRRSPIEVRTLSEDPDVAFKSEDGTHMRMYWMRARGIPKLDVPSQKVCQLL